MTTIDTRPDHGAISYNGTVSGGGKLATLTGWITTADHRQTGRLFIGSSLLTGVGTLVIGALLGFERFHPNDTALDAGAVDQLFALFRVALPYLVVLPLLLGIGIAVVPLQLGSRGIALGRATALGFWSWLFGAALVIISVIGNGGPGGGDTKMVDLYLASFGLTLLGLVIAAGALATSILTTRAPGMRLDRVPGLSFASLVGSVATLLTLPVLIGSVVLVAVDHRSGRNPGFGGNFDLLTWTGWGLTQPATFVLVIIALGIAADVVVTASGRRLELRPILLLGLGIAGTATLGSITQKLQLLPWEGSFGSDLGTKIGDLLPYLVFNALPVLGPLLVLAACGKALSAGKPAAASPAALSAAVLGLLLILLGEAAHVLTGVVDLQLAGTTYEEGSALLVLGGGLLVGLGGVVFWGPKLWGRRLPAMPTLGVAFLAALGVVLAGVPMLIAGFQGQPAMAAGGFDYDLTPQGLNAITAAGLILIALAVLAFAALAVKGFTSGDAAGDDPWDGQTLEWATSSPAPADNFAETPRVASAEPLLDLKPTRNA